MLTTCSNAIVLNVNGEDHMLVVEPNELLINVLRNELGLTGAKYGCGTGQCGACTVLVDGEPVLSCITLAVAVDGKEIVTIEGVAGADGELAPIQEEFLDDNAVQCGFCTPGMILVAGDLLRRNPHPTERRDPPPHQGQHLPLHRLQRHRARDPEDREAAGRAGRRRHRRPGEGGLAVTDTRYLRPRSLKEALEMMGEHWPGAKLLAGGTDLIPLFRAAKYSSDSSSASLGLQGGCKCGDCRIEPFPDVLVDVGDLDEIKGIRRNDGVLEVGAATVIADIASDPLLNETVPILADAARSIGNPLVRNRATIGGNLATAAPCADTAPPLLALDAIVQLASPEGRREMPIADYFLEYRTTSLRETEMIEGLLIPIPSEEWAGGFEKVRLRRSGAISVASVAAMVQSDGATCLRREGRPGLGRADPAARGGRRGGPRGTAHRR